MNPMFSLIRELPGKLKRSTAKWLPVCFFTITMLSPLRGSALSGSQQSSQEVYAHAESLVREGQWDEGIAALKPLIDASPNLRVLNLMGIALTGKGDLKRADAEFERALQVNPQFLPALKNLAVNEFNLHEFGASERHLTKALQLEPNDPVIHGYLGEIAFRRNEYSRAEEHLSRAGKLLYIERDFAAHLAISELRNGERQKALDLLGEIDVDQLSPRSQFEIGYALASDDLASQAAPYFKAVADAYPGSYDAKYDLAVCYLRSHNYEEAINTGQDLLRQGQENSDLENLLAQAYESNHQTKEAIEALRKAINLAPENEDNYLDLVTLCVKYNAYDLGMDVLKVGLHYHPRSARLIFQRGVLHAIHGESTLAEQDFELASRLAPDKNFSYIGMSLNSLQKGDLEHAVQILRQRVREKPDDFMLQYLLGRALLETGAIAGSSDFQVARKALETSIRLNPNFAASHVELGKIDIEENRFPDAITHLEKAVALDPQDNSAYSHLVIAYRREGKPELEKRAIDSLKRLNEEQHSVPRNGIHLIRENTAPPLPSPGR